MKVLKKFRVPFMIITLFCKYNRLTGINSSGNKMDLLTQYEYVPKDFNNALPIPGRVMALSNGKRRFLVIFEHGSQVPGSFYLALNSVHPNSLRKYLNSGGLSPV